MRLLLDQGLPRTTAAILTKAGIETVHVGDIGMATATDLDILEHARQRGETVVTLDSDFHAILALSGHSKPSVIRVRIEGLQAGEMADLLLRVVALTSEYLSSGAVVSVTHHRVRVRRLPLCSQ
ncbi:MAG: DUF5615 family PIN-like protein [Planctomycetes bacterium]|nr:DUF5615 family PIN-like protein [Planctomycetota bacterium]